MSFDRLAPFYRAMEFFAAGGKLQRCRLAYVGEIPIPRKILLAGEGHGKFLPACVRRFPHAEIVVVDISLRMLEIARGQVTSDLVTFIHSDILDWDGPCGQFDLIVTNFFLDCFPPDELAAVVEKLDKLAAPDADWLLADFEIAPAGAARWRTRVIVAMLYGFFNIVTGLRTRALTPPDEALEKAGFVRHRRITCEWGLLKSEWWWRRAG